VTRLLLLLLPQPERTGAEVRKTSEGKEMREAVLVAVEEEEEEC